MTADVNMTEKVARAVSAESVWEAIRDALAARHDNPGLDALLRIDPDDPEDMAARVLVEARGAIATAALSALADPDVQAGIAGVLREHRMAWSTYTRRVVCRGCDVMATGILEQEEARQIEERHQAAEVGEWLRGRAL